MLPPPRYHLTKRSRAATTVKNLYGWALLGSFSFMRYFISFKINLSTFLKKVLYWNKAQICIGFWVSFGFVFHQLWDESPKTQPLCEDFVRTEEMAIKTVCKEQIKKISIKTIDYLSIWAELHIAALTRKQGIQLSVPWH